MKKSDLCIYLLAALIVGSTLGLATAERHYFGVAHEDAGEAFKKNHRIMPEVLEGVGAAVASSEHWTGTEAQAHDLIRYSIIDQLYLYRPADFDVNVTLQMSLAHRMYKELTAITNPDGSRVYSDAVVELMIRNFKQNYDHGSAAEEAAPE